ncbi:MAG TPA: nucleotidyltransferase domain-containing protein, partial [Thermoanaerobaculia bacterium]|nr:nucleotidyltransferase domain-containing protein [Thermoanaerobaculia bacterium]
GEAREDSDIDLLVRPEAKTSPWFPAGLVLDLQDLLGRKVDVVTEGALHWYIRDRILREAVPL